jgi:NAD(P) transhydrogenase
MGERFDLVVLGAGPAGEKGAAQAAYFGKRVAIVEQAREPGGAGVHTGTLPSKTLREAAVFLSGRRARALYGVGHTLEPGSTLERLMTRKQVIADSESQRIRDNLRRHGVRYFEGRARVSGPHSVQVAGAEPAELEAEVILIATGSHPARPPGVAFEDPRIHDSDEILAVDELPRSLLILGAGVIGCEYACMFGALGVQVTLVDARATLLPFLDGELVGKLQDAMDAAGVTVQLGRRFTNVDKRGAQVITTFADGGELRAEHLLYCAGRIGATQDLGLCELGVVVSERGHVVVDADYRSAVPSIFAAGDVIGFPGLASSAMEQARVAVCKAFGFAYKHAVSALMPFGIYTIPALSGVGETEQSCREKHLDYVVGRAPYAQNARAKIVGDHNGVLKLIAARADRRLLGVHVIGERATELVHIGQAVIELDGCVDVFIDMVWNHPTLSELYKYAAYDLLHALNTERRGSEST